MVYINGELDGETANNEGLFASNLPAWISGYGSDDEFGSNRHFPGIIDEVRFWDGALTQDEIQESMNPATAAVDASDKLSVTWGNIKD